VRRSALALALGALALGCTRDASPDATARLAMKQPQVDLEVAALSCQQPFAPRNGVAPTTLLRDDEGLVRYRVIDFRSDGGRAGPLWLNEPRTGDIALFLAGEDGNLVLTRLERGNPDRRTHTLVEIGPRERSEWGEKLRAVLQRIERGCEASYRV